MSSFSSGIIGSDAVLRRLLVGSSPCAFGDLFRDGDSSMVGRPSSPVASEPGSLPESRKVLVEGKCVRLDSIVANPGN